MDKKQLYIKRTFAEIRAKGLREPIQLNKATIIHDLERYLATIEKALLNNNKRQIERLFVYKLETLLKFNQ